MSSSIAPPTVHLAGPAPRPAAPPRPQTEARIAFRQKMAAKHADRQRRTQPAAVAWQFTREAADVLWHQQDSVRGKVTLLGVALLVTLVPPVLVLVALYNAVSGGQP
jgi:hypothetical protein